MIPWSRKGAAGGRCSPGALSFRFVLEEKKQNYFFYRTETCGPAHGRSHDRDRTITFTITLTITITITFTITFTITITITGRFYWIFKIHNSGWEWRQITQAK